MQSTRSHLLMINACMPTSRAIQRLVPCSLTQQSMSGVCFCNSCQAPIEIQSVPFFQTFSQTNVTKVCPGSQCMFAFYGGESVYHRYILVLHLCNLFVFFWLVNFTIALGQCTLAGAFASYYWALKKPNDIPACPLFSSFSRAIR